MRKSVGFIGLAVIALAFVVGLFMRPLLPEKVPVHWNALGQVDRFGSQSEALYIMPAISLFLLLLLWGLPALSPKGKGVEGFRPQYEVTVLSVVAFMSAMHIILLTAGFRPINILMIIMAMVCVLFMIIGNVLGKVTRNPWMGIRTPWTLESDSVWEKTHRMAGKTMVGGSVIGLVFCLTPWPILALIPTMAGTLYPVLYSYQVYKNEQKSGNGPKPSSV